MHGIMQWRPVPVYVLLTSSLVWAFSGSYCPVGVQTPTRVPDSAITISVEGTESFYSDTVAGKGGRLYGPTAFDARSIDQSGHLRIVLDKSTVITGVAIQGSGTLGGPDKNEATNFTFSYRVGASGTWTSIDGLQTGIIYDSTTNPLQTDNVNVRSTLFNHGESGHSDGFTEVFQSSPGGVNNLTNDSVVATEVRFSVTGRTGTTGTSAPLRVELYTPCVYAEYFGWQQINFAGAPVINVAGAPGYRGYTVLKGYQNMSSPVNWGLAFRTGPLAFNRTGAYSTKWEAVAAATGLSMIRPVSEGIGGQPTGGLVWIGPNVNLLWSLYEGVNLTVNIKIIGLAAYTNAEYLKAYLYFSPDDPVPSALSLPPASFVLANTTVPAGGANFSINSAVDVKQYRRLAVGFQSQLSTSTVVVMECVFISGQRKSCYVENCSSCMPLTNRSCFECQEGFSLLPNMTCTKDCPAGFFSTTYDNDFFSIPRVCLACTSGCATCSITSYGGCSSCVENKFLFEARCIDDCAIHTSGTMYGNTTTRECTPTINCSLRVPEQWQTNVSVSATADRGCQPLSACLIGYYDSFFDSPDYNFDRTTDRICLPCPEGTTDLRGEADSTPCTPCYVGNCSSCVPFTNRSCFECQEGFSLLPNTTCTKNCPAGFFSTNYSVESSLSPSIPIPRVCLACTSGCATCSITSYGCSSCVENKFLFEAQCISDCASHTYGTMYGNTTTRKCAPSINCSLRVPEQWQTNVSVSATADRGCQPLSACPIGYYDRFFDSPDYNFDRTTDRICLPCPEETTDLRGEADSTPCTPCTVCSDGDVAVGACSAHQDVSCTAAGPWNPQAVAVVAIAAAIPAAIFAVYVVAVVL